MSGKGGMLHRRPRLTPSVPGKQLGTVLDKGQAGLIVIYATNMADQVAASIKAQDRYISQAIDANADELAKQLKAAEGE